MEQESAAKRNPPPLEWEEGLTDEELFEMAMHDVDPLPARDRMAPRRSPSRWPAADSDPDSPRRRLIEALEGGGIQDGRSLSGGPRQGDPLLMRRLRAGRFSVEAELDLHGLSRQQARQEIEEFLLRCSQRELTCVRLVHGKGNNSQGGTPVLKRLVPRWLGERRLSRYLVAYATARPVDGGDGALYLLLRSGYRRGGRAMRGRRTPGAGNP